MYTCVAVKFAQSPIHIEVSLTTQLEEVYGVQVRNKLSGGCHMIQMLRGTGSTELPNQL